MPDHVHQPQNLIYSVGTQVVSRRDILDAAGTVLHLRGSVGEVVRSPADLDHHYTVKFTDGREHSLTREDVVMLALFQEGDLGFQSQAELYDRVFFKCIIGSRAYGLDDDNSDTDYRGIFLPTAAQHWGLAGVPGQIENHSTQEHYWELERFLVLALKANPNLLECLSSPLVVKATPLAEELLTMRSCFLSKLVYQTFNGYVQSQFRKMQADLRNHGAIKPKHAMHMIRLLISGIGILRTGEVQVQVGEHRDQLLAIKYGTLGWDEMEHWRHRLHADFDAAFATTTLPDRPDYERANAFLLKARWLALAEELP
ncbi:nucleotidyltransferase domain-containing protein [soil metagenome]